MRLVTFEGKENTAASTRSGSTPWPNQTWVYNKGNTAQIMLVQRHRCTSCHAKRCENRRPGPHPRGHGRHVTDLEYDYATNTSNPWAKLPVLDSLLPSGTLNKNRALPLLNNKPLAICWRRPSK